MQAVPLNQTLFDRAARHLTNPNIRVPLRPDFPPVISFSQNLPGVIKTLTAELAKYGETLETVGQITLAYPHKHPVLFPNVHNHGLTAANALHDALKFELRQQIPALLLDLPRADAICDTLHLDRSGNRTIWHALTARQHYDVYDRMQQKPLAFLDPAQQDKPHYFIIVDWHIEQGTTVADLASYLAHNGARVLLAATNTGDSGTPLVPRNDYTRDQDAHLTLRAPFASAANNRALPALGQRLVQAAAQSGIVVDRDDTLAQMEVMLNSYGNSLTALTHVETQRLMRALQFNRLSYRQLTMPVKKERATAPKRLGVLERLFKTK